jgi:hypothetical protein
MEERKIKKKTHKKRLGLDLVLAERDKKGTYIYEN